MTTPSALFPYSPTPDSPAPAAAANVERRRSKRESTASQTRRFDDVVAAQQRYPSPPSSANDGGSRQRSQHYDPSLVIPPYNAANKRAAAAPEVLTHTQPTLHHDLPVVPAARPVSAAIVPVQHSNAATGPTGATSSSRSRQSVSHVTPASHSNQPPFEFPYTPHPIPEGRRVMFGPYLLLQTLGEGEFGKVKLGLHTQRWGEECAIKLIKRGNVDTVQRTAKVKREIDVLKVVRHPNIVRLYDVIETEKYIGIVLEYASGGELFDHILAHRYLKERDATKLFAQLISAVMYLHAKGVVHRDLKLENLLLDRNRNVIVTDFGFANRFFDARRDLMATSCGSPCYAAPELVIQDGKYVGTAVDVWSCGVILYAMLAGYLPYDDDPANPEGDNINLLYKYITTTELTFPDWIGQEARHLLLMMLVSDPNDRCTIQDVANHSWLANYHKMLSLTVPQLEHQAQRAEIAKRQALEAQRQYLLQQQELERAAASGAPPHMTRSQSSTLSAAAANKHKSAIVISSTAQHALASMAEEAPITTGPPPSRAAVVQPYQPASKRRSIYNNAPSPTTQAHPVTVDADTFSFDRNSPLPPSGPVAPPMSASLSAPPMVSTVAEEAPPRNERRQPSSGDEQMQPRSRPGSTTPSTQSRRSSARDLLLETHLTDSERRKKANRATIQLEYTPSKPCTPSESSFVATPVAASSPVPPVPSVPTAMADTEVQDVDMVHIDNVASSLSSRASDLMSTDSIPEEETAVPSQVAAAVVPETTSALAEERPSTPPAVHAIMSDPTTPIANPSTATPKKRKNGSPASESNTNALMADLPALPVAAIPSADTTPRAKKTNGSSHASGSDSASIQAPSIASSGARPHRKTASSTDRFSLLSLLGSSTASVDRTSNNKAPSSVATNSGVSSDASDREKSTLEELTNRRKSRRQKALSLQPFKLSSSQSGYGSKPATPTKYSPGLSSTAEGAASLNMSQASTSSTSRWAGITRSSTLQRLDKESLPSSASTTSINSSSTPSGKAKMVMDWFRRRGSNRNSLSTSTIERPPIPTEFERKPLTQRATRQSQDQHGRHAASSVSSRASHAPSLVVTESDPSEMTSIPSSRSASAAQSSSSHFSNVTSTTAATTASTVSTQTPLTPTKASMSHSLSVGGGPPSSSTGSAVTLPGQQPVPPVFAENKLRIHQGATNKNMVTTRSPPAVMVELKNALWSMGIDFVIEGDYRLKCTRQSRRKALASSVSGSGSGPSPQLGQSASLAPSPSLSSSLAPSPSMSFRQFFSRRNSLLGSPSATRDPTSYYFDSPTSPAMQASSSSNGGSAGFGTLPQPMPTYGDAQTDVADEVKFNVELTRVRDLQGVYCVDVRRLKGELKSFKFVYQSLLANVQLASSVATATMV